MSNLEENEDEDTVDAVLQNGIQDDVTGLDWLLGKESNVTRHIPMDNAVLVTTLSENNTTVDHSRAFSRKKIFEAAARGDPGPLIGLQEYLRGQNKRLTSAEFTDETNGKTALLKALLNLKDGRNDTIEVLLNIAEQSGYLETFVNASYNDIYYKGQTALHVAIERRSFDQVKLLVEKGADVQAKANGAFFQLHSRQGFYFGELPLSLAACTNQLDVVSFLMENPYSCANCRDQDSQGNTVLHALVVIVDNAKENTDFIINMYDEILIRQSRNLRRSGIELEAIKNKEGLTALKLAAKLGKIGLFKHMLQREFTDEESRLLSRKFTDWIYGPIHSSLYDMTDIDTSEDNSVLEIILFGSEIQNRQEMLQVEPLCSLLEEKWKRFAAVFFLINFLVYLLYLGIFTAVACHRKEGKPPFAVEDTPVDHLRCIGELITVLGAVFFFIKAIVDFKRKPPHFKSMHIDGFNEVSFFLQASLLLVSTVLYCFGVKEYVAPLVISLAFAWINILYYSRGSRLMGMYNVMIQRMIISDLLRFLFVYVVFLYGFSAAVVTLTRDDYTNHTVYAEDMPSTMPQRSYNDIRFTALELFKFTIGMGNLDDVRDHVQDIEVFYFLLISYIVLTYVLLFNMLIALMGNTVERISRESESIWKLQRALTIVSLEKALPQTLRNKLQSGMMKTLCFIDSQGCRTFFRVEEIDWKKWRSNLGMIKEEDPTNDDVQPDPKLTSGSLRRMWGLNPLWIRSRRTQPDHSSSSFI